MCQNLLRVTSLPMEASALPISNQIDISETIVCLSDFHGDRGEAPQEESTGSIESPEPEVFPEQLYAELVNSVAVDEPSLEECHIPEEPTNDDVANPTSNEPEDVTPILIPHPFQRCSSMNAIVTCLRDGTAILSGIVSEMRRTYSLITET